ncbi:hypothetical protein [Dickeya dianthicola]|uniref:hypothetical protein n=1 Tax=Dickeya dianthicola TaxID=204039 RepID=UPI001868F2F2|nr:hypothetical protein [Dickeya dianthicola]QOL14501.1 hypothetical protein HGI48_09980 [Dickeya dianthicola]
MPQVIVTEKARQGINRCLIFLENNSADYIINDVKNAVADSLDNLEKELITGFISDEEDEDDFLYEVIIPYGDSGYEYCYFIDAQGSYIVVGFKHQKENDYY